MVILKDENLPPCKWTMGRILEIVKGSDGKVRVVKVKTPQGKGLDAPHLVHLIELKLLPYLRLKRPFEQ
ncbi:hypothetical protein TNCV_101201 [Trichonephila clavipes]|nr:hypothetical protein TNCV_101201 [Trichonephila clavipes]